MRLIDADALIAEINDRIDAAIKWGVNAIADGDNEIKLRAEQAVATFCEASLTAKKMPTIDAVEVIRCGKCRHYQGNHDVPGCAPCAFWGIGGVMWNDFCKRGEEWDG